MQDKNQLSIYHAAVYVRLSKEDRYLSYSRKTESDSISNQKQLIFDFLKNKTDIEIVSVRIDDGYTGTNYNRPAFQLMLDDIKAGLVNCVVVKDLSRFGREYIDGGKYIDRLFPFYGVRLIAINDGIDTITKDASDEFGITVRNLFNDNYCRDISIKTRSSLKTKRKNGEYTGSFTPYGYKRSETGHNQLVVDEYPASVVQDIFKWKIAGMNQKGIANRLNQNGVLSPSEYKRSIGERYQSGFRTKGDSGWTAVTVRRILTNEVYTGNLVQGIRTTPNYKLKHYKTNTRDECCVVEESHEPLVSRKTFELVQKLLLLDTRTSPKEDYVFPLAGMLECGDCKSPMVKKVSICDGKEYSYYVCKKSKELHTCSPHRIRADELEKTVLVTLQKHIQSIMEMDSLLNELGRLPYRKIQLKKAEEKLEQIESEMLRYRNLKIMLYEDMKDGLVSKEDYVDINKQYEEKIKLAEKSKSQMKKEKDRLFHNATDQQEWIQDFLKYRNLTCLTRAAVVELIEKVIVFEDKKIVIEFCHSQEFHLSMNHIEEFNKKQMLGEVI